MAPELTWIVEVEAAAEDFGDFSDLLAFGRRVPTNRKTNWWLEVGIGERDSNKDKLDPNKVRAPVCTLTITVIGKTARGFQARPVLGFSNDPRQCDERRRDGVLLLEAAIVFSQKEASLYVDARALSLSAESTDGLQVRILGLRHPVRSKRRGSTLNDTVSVSESFERITSDVAEPEDQLEIYSRQESRKVARVEVGKGKIVVGNRPPLDATVWQASVTKFQSPVVPGSGKQGKSASSVLPVRCHRRDRWSVPPAYRFEAVDVIGFRLNLLELGFEEKKVDEAVRKIVSPLNVDSRQDAWSPYQIEPASPTLNIELLRYPRMQFDRDGELNFQQQHELLVRVLVGRVDEASRQARDPAFYVPAIFVDNVWSKVLGRELQGFDKQLAVFKAGDQELLPSGRAKDDTRIVPLTDVTEVCLRTRLGPDSGGQQCSLIRFDGLAGANSSKFIDVDRGALTSAFALGGLGWRQADFEQKEFRRAFARDFMASRRAGFRSLQVTPTDDRLRLAEGQKRLISAACRFEKVRVCLPTASATLELRKSDGRVSAWDRLVEVCGGKSLPFSAGDWYRLKCDMTLEVENALRWHS